MFEFAWVERSYQSGVIDYFGDDAIQIGMAAYVNDFNILCLIIRWAICIHCVRARVYVYFFVEW